MDNLRYLKAKKRTFIAAKKIFEKYFKDEISFNYFFNTLKNKDKDKFLKISFFCYWRWWRFDEKFKAKIDDFPLIIFASMIEAAISEKNYRDFYSWYMSSEYKEKNKEIKELWEEYKSQYGSTKKFIHFFNRYLSKENKDMLSKNFLIWNKEKKKCSLDEIAKILYQLRSNFVHNAEYIPIPAGDYSNIFFCIKNKCFLLEKPNNIFSILEEGIINYFKEKSKEKNEK